ncbi:ribonuclease III domain-containing protein [Carboxydochorda subterranea]|uniref:Mini-ribonuclease 3 n=1 Tax=Carboxydichorda subterranea TaxID=3109565 RepID=A0ABZ1BYN3_9FIRM|nr:ribonuclease III domain-containing protein [Limnochorda sp. L945t]WRP17703.1 ribonuclease III domain-containing protein [Limnochorda sp. L945t]
MMNGSSCQGMPGRPALLAYLGDAVFELLARTMVVERMAGPGGDVGASLQEIHRTVLGMAAAQGQAALLDAIWPLLTEAEQDVARRGRNVHLRHHPRGAPYRSYRHSTALEALMGHLYLTGQTERLVELMRAGLERTRLHEGLRP